MIDRHPLDGNAIAAEALRTAHIAAKEAIRAAQRLADDTYDAWRDAVEAEADKPADQFTRPEDQK